PALVHDLRREEGIEVEGLLAHGEENVPLPILELGRVVGDEPEQIAFGMRRYRRALALLDGRPGAVRIEGRETSAELVVDDLGLRQILRITLASQRLVDIDVLLERERGVEHRLDALHAVALDRLLDLPRVTRRV